MSLFKSQSEELQEKNKLLLEDEKRFRIIFEQSAVGESIVATDGRWLDVNRRLCEITGYSKGELLGKNFIDITHPDDIAKSTEVRENVLSGKTAHKEIEKRYIKKNGDIVWVLLSISLIHKDGVQQPYFAVHTQDITEFKKMEQRLSDLKEKYSAIVENGNDGIVIIQDFKTKFYNHALSEITGYPVGEFEEKPFLNYISKDFSALVKKNYEDRIAGKETEQRYEVEIVKKDGSILPVEISGSVINYDGKPADMVFIRDISKQKKAEVDLESKVKELEDVNKIMIGREVKMAELKKEVEFLRKRTQNGNGKNNHS